MLRSALKKWGGLEIGFVCKILINHLFKNWILEKEKRKKETYLWVFL